MAASTGEAPVDWRRTGALLAAGRKRTKAALSISATNDCPSEPTREHRRTNERAQIEKRRRFASQNKVDNGDGDDFDDNHVGGEEAHCKLSQTRT